MNRVTRACAFAATSIACVSAGAGAGDAMGFGAHVSALGDVNGDRVPDFAVGSAAGGSLKLLVCSGKDGATLWSSTGFDAAAVPNQTADGGPGVAVAGPGSTQVGSAAGSVVLYEGATGRLIRAVAPQTPDAARSELKPDIQEIACPGDVDGDGKPDLLVVGVQPNPDPRAAPNARRWCESAEACVVSLDGKLIADLKPWVDVDHRTFLARPAFDADGDGRTDFLVHGTGDKSNLPVQIVSATKGVLMTFKGDALHAPEAVAVLGDVDGDKKPDLLFGLPIGGEIEFCGEVRIVSGKDGKVLRTVRGEKKDEYLGSAVAGIGDADGDGVPDFAAGAPGVAGGKDALLLGAVRAFSGKTGKTLWTTKGTLPTGELGRSLAAIGDVDGDGVSDVVAGAPGAPGAGLTPGYALLVSGKTGKVIATIR